MIVRFQIVKSAVMSAVKLTTYLKGKIDESGDPNALKISTNEVASESDSGDQKLTDLFDTAIEKAKIIFIDYLAPTAQTIGDNVIYYNDETDDVIDFVLDVSRRYNGTLANTLARLTANYIESYMTYWWWIKTTNLKQAEPYKEALAIAEQEIRRSFVLCPPTVPKYPYTKSLVAKVDGSETDSSITLEVGKDETLSYSIDDGAIDDIEARSEDPSILEIHRCKEKRTFTLRPIQTGIVDVKLWSRHSDKIETKIEVTVTEEEEV